MHFGPGAFHRVHQAHYFDSILATQPDWGICAVSLKTPQLRHALLPQQGLYTTAILDASVQFRVIGALRECLVAAQQPQQVLARLADPQTRLVTATVTEKGYCLRADGELDLLHPEIVSDLANPGRPVSLVGWLYAGLAARCHAGAAPFTVISCDNLADNGSKLGAAVASFADCLDPVIARWIRAEVAFPRTMVDSICPATDQALRDRVEQALGMPDRWPVQRESWCQWVLEPRFCNEVPDFAAAGVTLSSDVKAWEQAKLRLLNGAHSSLAYLGLLAGKRTVAEAIADPQLAGFIEQLMTLDILPTLRAPEGTDLGTYACAVRERFRNPALAHQLAQIAWDGSQKLPFRLFGTICDALNAGRDLTRLATVVVGWLRFLQLRLRERIELVDPLAPLLLRTAADCSGDAETDIARFLEIREVFPQYLRESDLFRAALVKAWLAP